MDKDKFTIINGPNLNLLGLRERDVYGDMSLEDIRNYTEKALGTNSVEIDWFQSNSEGEIVDKIHSLHFDEIKTSALVINPGAFSHTSLAILDALKTLNMPIVEVHLSNTNRREHFRSLKLTAKAATIIMEGLGRDAYLMAIKSQLSTRN